MIRITSILYTIGSMLLLYYSNPASRLVRGSDKILNYLVIAALSGCIIFCKNIKSIDKHWLFWLIGFQIARTVLTGWAINAQWLDVTLVTNYFFIGITILFCIFVLITLYTKKKL